MAEKRQDSGFTVTDRRLFTEDGELRSDVRDASVTCASVEQKPIPKFQIDEPDVRQTNVSTPHAARSVSGG